MKWIQKILAQLNEEIIIDDFNTELKLKRLAELHKKNKRIVEPPKNEK